MVQRAPHPSTCARLRVQTPQTSSNSYFALYYYNQTVITVMTVLLEIYEQLFITVTITNGENNRLGRLDRFCHSNWRCLNN